ncbi:hypothetical protein J422_03129 [Methanocaldococcus villosus KIN24-T80]|uniref:Uncharacterized protein n=1 Tax=Methanocaldococcus villosus KIN24-T80 TaxID=1069083 RepID=N6UVD7_9EURY|nr:DUF530 family protein [Methanocaldococcus villosus]ENN96319.1 hypothetical protein J422_03129 [Methanocaldococcus villosus KIN24-T80]
METSNLIKEANEFLDNIKIDFEKNNLDDIIKKLKDNIKILQELKSKMEFLEFDNPYKNVGKVKLVDSESLQELATYSSYLRRIAGEKKGVLERVKHALTAHKIALAHLVDEIGNKRLPPNLPLDGAYKEHLFELPPYLISIYKEFLDMLEPKGKGVLTSYTVSLIIFKNGKREFKRVRVEDKNYEKYIKEKYGNAIITSIKRNYSKNKIIDDQYVRRVLAIGYIKAYKTEVEREIEKRLKKLLSKEERNYLEKYYMILNKFKDEKEEVCGGILDIRQLEEKKLKELELKRILENEGLIEDEELIIPLKRAIEIRNKVSKEVAKEIIFREFSEDVFKFYLYKTPDERARSFLFPSIMVSPNKGYLFWMDKKKADLLDTKFKLEELLPKFNIGLKNIGGVLLYLFYDWDMVEKYKFKKEEIEDLLKKIALIEPIKEILKDKIDIKKLEKFGKVKKEKTKKFLSLLKEI